MSQHLLEVKDLYFSFDTYAGEVQAVRGVSFHVDEGETLAIVGESGCGKSVTVQTIMGLTPTPPGRIKSGSILYQGRELVGLNHKEMAKLRGKEMAMIFQDPMTCLNPTMRVGRQIEEAILKHESVTRLEAHKRACEMLGKVGIPEPEKNARRYPHQFSGGMRQRVMIAMALSCNPRILFADEPTTALDVTTQAQILDLMNALKHEFRAAVVIITHDLGVVARVSQRVNVMYAGKIVESGNVRDVFYQPKHPYTWGLMQSLPGQSGSNSRILTAIEGTPPDLFAPPAGCGFAPRCAYCMQGCLGVQPSMTDIGGGHGAACHLLNPRAPKVEIPIAIQKGGEIIGE